MSGSVFHRVSTWVVLVSTCLCIAPAYAAIYTFSHTGKLTMLASDGTALPNPDNGGGLRTDISGTLAFDDELGTLSLDINPVAFFGDIIDFGGSGSNGELNGATPIGGPLEANDNLQFDFGADTNVNVSITWDVTGLWAATQFGLSVGDKISGDVLLDSSNAVLVASLGSGIPATELAGPSIGPAPVASISSTPMTSGQFAGFSLFLDIGDAGSLIVTSVVPVPAAFYLFTTGLLGLVAVARHKAKIR